MAQQVESKNRATSSEDARQQVVAKCKTEGIESMLLWFTDLEGHLKSFAITPDELEGALDDGMGFDGSSITGFNAIEESDMVAIPDPDTFVVMPWRSGESKVGRMICDVVTPDGKPYEGDPRYVLRRALERMQGLGFDTFNVGPELEYFLFKDAKGTETLDEGGYFAMTTQDAATSCATRQSRRSRRSASRSSTTTRGRPVPARDRHALRDALDMADHTLTYRLIVKEIARRTASTRRSCRSRSSARTARACTRTVALQRRPERVLRRGRQVAPLRRRQGIHRRPAPPRARDRGGVRAVGELVQAARARATRRRSTSPGRSGTARR
jgi:hypothetical protein